MNMFRTVFTVMRKELRDLSRDRRTLALALFLGPLLYPALMLGMGYLTENRIRTQVDKTLEIPMVGAEHAPNLVKFLATNGITAAPAPANLDTAIRTRASSTLTKHAISRSPPPTKPNSAPTPTPGPTGQHSRPTTAAARPTGS